MTDLIPESEKEARHGLSIQAITPIVFSPKFFVQVTPVYSNNDLGTSGSGTYIQELLAQYALKETLQSSGFYRGVFADNDHTIIPSGTALSSILSDVRRESAKEVIDLLDMANCEIKGYEKLSREF